jgi:Secretion system C-terminal sorting domain
LRLISNPFTNLSFTIIKTKRVYPIPAITSISIMVKDELVNKPMVISLYNSYGQGILRKQIIKANAIESIDVSKYANGIYLLSVTTYTEIIIAESKIIISK